MNTARAQSAVAAAVIGSLVLALFALLDRLGLAWRPWLDFLVATGSIFGSLGARFARELREPDCLVFFILVLAVHVGAFIRLLRAGAVFSVWCYLPVGGVEVLALAWLFSVLAGPGRDGRAR